MPFFWFVFLNRIFSSGFILLSSAHLKQISYSSLASLFRVEFSLLCARCSFLKFLSLPLGLCSPSPGGFPSTFLGPFTLLSPPGSWWSSPASGDQLRAEFSEILSSGALWALQPRCKTLAPSWFSPCFLLLRVRGVRPSSSRLPGRAVNRSGAPWHSPRSHLWAPLLASRTRLRDGSGSAVHPVRCLSEWAPGCRRKRAHRGREQSASGRPVQGPRSAARVPKHLPLPALGQGRKARQCGCPCRWAWKPRCLCCWLIFLCPASKAWPGGGNTNVDLGIPVSPLYLQSLNH